MNFLRHFHQALVVLFVLLNGMMLYLFLLNLSYGLDLFLATFRKWQALSPQAGYAMGFTVVLMGMAVFTLRRLDDQWKNRLLFFRWREPHPARDAFLSTRRQPFGSGELLSAFPEVKDAGFDPGVQVESWERAHQRHAANPVVLNTEIHWRMLRDLYVLGLLFLIVFLLGWLAKAGIPFQLVATYVFLFGAQVLFLLLAARRLGFRLVDNVLGVELGLGE
ncbi:MAG: hypothetical protein G8D28_08480 [gamma proteobacterium symbiont of Phacoides pectinatus]